MNDEDEVQDGKLKLFLFNRVTDDGRVTDVKLWAKDWAEAEEIAKHNDWTVLGTVVSF